MSVPPPFVDRALDALVQERLEALVLEVYPMFQRAHGEAEAALDRIRPSIYSVALQLMHTSLSPKGEEEGHFVMANIMGIALAAKARMHSTECWISFFETMESAFVDAVQRLPQTVDRTEANTKGDA